VHARVTTKKNIYNCTRVSECSLSERSCGPLIEFAFDRDNFFISIHLNATFVIRCFRQFCNDLEILSWISNFEIPAFFVRCLHESPYFVFVDLQIRDSSKYTTDFMIHKPCFVSVRSFISRLSANSFSLISIIIKLIVLENRFRKHDRTRAISISSKSTFLHSLLWYRI